MSNPRNSQEAFDAAFEELAKLYGMDVREFIRHWNEGARRADAEWALQPHERSGWQGDTDTSGAPLYGPGSREAKHKTHMLEQKEKE